jgi:hypothetical protein
VPHRGILVVIDGFAHEWVRVYSRFRIEFPCIIQQEFFDGGEVRFSMELSVPDEPRGIKSRSEEFVLHDLQLLELRVRHGPPDRRAVHHGRSDHCSINCEFVLDGHLTSPIDQRIKLFSNHLSASFPVIKLSIEPKVVVESYTEVPDLGFPRDGSLEHDDFASRTVTTPSEKNRTAFVWTHVNSPEAKP